MENLIRDFVLAAGGAFGGGLVVLAGEQVIQYCRRPIVNTSFDRNAHPAIVITVDTTVTIAGGEPTKKPGTWFRLWISNDGNGTGTGCEVSMVKLRRTRPAQYSYENDPIGLSWSLTGNSALNLHAKTSRFCDILFVRDDFFHRG